jgi:heat shock protein HslJ
MKTTFAIIAVIISSVMLSSCTSSGNSNIGKEYELNKIWVLQNLHGKTADKITWPNGIPWMELKINSTTFGGNTGCNGMGGTVHATSEKITFYNIIDTRMYCVGVDEIEFLVGLESSRYWTIENDRLFLYDAPGGVVIAVFKEGTVPETEVQ